MVRQIEDPELRALCHRLLSPYWMKNPSSWIWKRKDGSPQGLSYLTAEPGLMNLLWLTMECGTPPLEYEGGDNALYMDVLLSSPGAKLGGESLLNVAAVSTLQQFHDRLPGAIGPGARGLERFFPLLKVIAARRIEHG